VSQAHVKLTQDAFAAYDRGGIEAALQYFDRDVELVAPPDWPEEPILRGHAGLRQIMAGWFEQFGGFRLGLERVIDAGDHSALALFSNYIRIKGSDREIMQPSALHLEFNGDKITRWHAYLSWEDALTAVGLGE
jgi:ketosteroid isomerase-like protein